MTNIIRNIIKNILKIGYITKLARSTTEMAMIHIGYYIRNSKNNDNKLRTEDLPPLSLPPCHDPCRDMKASANSPRLMAEPRSGNKHDRRNRPGISDRVYRNDRTNATGNGL